MHLCSSIIGKLLQLFIFFGISAASPVSIPSPTNPSGFDSSRNSFHQLARRWCDGSSCGQTTLSVGVVVAIIVSVLFLVVVFISACLRVNTRNPSPVIYSAYKRPTLPPYSTTPKFGSAPPPYYSGGASESNNAAMMAGNNAAMASAASAGAVAGVTAGPTSSVGGGGGGSGGGGC